MPSVLRQRLNAQAAARWTRRAQPRARAPFIEQTAILGEVPLDAWGGWDGSGWGPNHSLFVTTGTRFGGTNSLIYRLDAPDGGWAQETSVPHGAETINKLRSGPARSTGVDRLWAFYEGPQNGQRFLISREAGTGWGFESVPGHASGDGGPVGGRGLGITLGGGPGSRVLAGASYEWLGDQRGRLFEQQATGSWAEVRSHDPSLMWEIEFDDQGRVWEFWSDFGLSGGEARLYVNGVQRATPPGGDISCAGWFKGHMYVCGDLAKSDAHNQIHRSVDGSSWARVHTFQSAQKADHVTVIPRGDGELWATGQAPFEAAWTLDGVTWTREATLPAFVTAGTPQGTDTNHRTAIAYWQGAVWVFARDHGAGTCRVFTDQTETPPEPEPEPSPVPGGPVFFPSLTVPPRPPELPTVPVPPTQPQTKAADVFPRGEPPPMQKWVEGADRFVAETSLRFDALLTKWIEEFLRVMKDAWVRLQTLVTAVVGRVLVLETRIADTYTWGQKGALRADEPIALPLRVVRNEELVEMTIAADHEDSRGGVTIDLTRNGTTILSGRLSGDDLAVIAPNPGITLTRNDILAVIARNVDADAAGIVVQARCR
jgi:hypothetical protein